VGAVGRLEVWEGAEMSGKLIFLDCDGVLNDHKQHANGYCGTTRRCVQNLNRILRATDA
jgi:hypothetical protein